MGKPNEQITPDRLCDAAEAVMLAVVEVADRTRGGWIYPPELMGSADQPQCLCDFTRFEVEQATQFLIRLGMVEVVR
jgi:hypothetical protein